MNWRRKGDRDLDRDPSACIVKKSALRAENR